MKNLAEEVAKDLKDIEKNLLEIEMACDRLAFEEESIKKELEKMIELRKDALHNYSQFLDMLKKAKGLE